MDPLTIALLAGSGIANYLGERKLGKEKEKFFGQVEQEGRAESKKALEARGEYGVGDTYRKYLQYAMADPTADFQRQQLRRQEASGVEALKAGGARAILGGLGAQQQRMSDIAGQIAQAEFGRKAGALQTYGAVEQAVAGEKLRDARTDLAMAREQVASGMEGRFEGQLQKKMAGYNALGQGLEAAAYAMTPTPEAKSGMKLPGEFSHAKNPIDIMQDGSKIAEATGDEYVINPEQARKIAKQSKYAAQLFKKFDKEA